MGHLPKGVSTSPSADMLANAARKTLDDYGVHWSPSKLKRVALKFKYRAPDGTEDEFMRYVFAEVKRKADEVKLKAAQRRRAQQVGDPYKPRFNHDPVGETAWRHADGKPCFCPICIPATK